MGKTRELSLDILVVFCAFFGRKVFLDAVLLVLARYELPALHGEPVQGHVFADVQHVTLEVHPFCKSKS